jgi:Trehalose receptor
MATLTAAMQCGAEHQTKVFYFLTYPMIFQKFPQLYHPLVGFVAKLMSYITSITWAYRDLFIINNSIAFTMSFREINKALFTSGENIMLPSFYWKYRNLYAKLRALMEEFDDALNVIIFLAIGNNIFVICSHLFSGLK